MNREALSQHFHLVMVELWGHGQSPETTDASEYSISAYLDQFEKIRRSLDISRWSLAGQSYGAGLIVNYALTHPRQIDAVVVTNSRSAFGQLDRRQRSSDDSPAEQNDVAAFDPRPLPYHPIHARRFPEHVKTPMVAYADAMSAATVSLGGRLGAQLNSVALLKQVRAPILLTNGVYEKSFQDDVAKLRALYPELDTIDLQGGHSVNIEAADGFNEAVIAFLNQHTP